MSMGNNSISKRARLGVVAFALATIAIIALTLGTYGAPIAASTTASKPAISTPAAANNAAAEQKAKAMFASMPLYFEVNQGQTDPSVRYLSHVGSYSLYLTDDATVLSLIAGHIRKGPTYATTNRPAPKDANRLIQSAVRIRMLGANPHPTMTGLETCFEEELAKLPGWHSEFMDLEHTHTAQEPLTTKQDKTVEEAMVLGV